MGDGRVGLHPGQEVGWKGEMITPLLLRLAPRAPGRQLVEGFQNDLEIGADLGVVEAHQHLLGLHLSPSCTNRAPTTPPTGC